MEKKTVLDRVEVQGDGLIRIRVMKQIVDGEEVEKSELHEASFMPDMDVDQRITQINDHLANMKYPPLPQNVIDAVKSHTKVAHTPEVVAAYKAKVKAANEAALAEIEKAKAKNEPKK